MELTRVVLWPEFVEECKSILIETRFNSSWAKLEGYHQLGKRIREEFVTRKWAQNDNGRVFAELREQLKLSESTLYRAVQFAEKYPELNDLPCGKSISWSKLVRDYLPSDDKKLVECSHDPIIICKYCKKVLGDYHAIRNL